MNPFRHRSRPTVLLLGALLFALAQPVAAAHLDHSVGQDSYCLHCAGTGDRELITSAALADSAPLVQLDPTTPLLRCKAAPQPPEATARAPPPSLLHP